MVCSGKDEIFQEQRNALGWVTAPQLKRTWILGLHFFPLAGTDGATPLSLENRRLDPPMLKWHKSSPAILQQIRWVTMCSMYCLSSLLSLKQDRWDMSSLHSSSHGRLLVWWGVDRSARRVPLIVLHPFVGAAKWSTPSWNDSDVYTACI